MFYSETGQYVKTLEHIQAAKLMEPYDQGGKYRFLSGLVNRKLGKPDEARKDLWYAMLLNPDYVKDDYWIKNNTIYRELISDFIIFSNDILDGSFSDENYIQHLIPIAEILKNAGFEDQAGRLYQATLARYAGNSDLVSNAALHYISQGNPALAEKAIFQGLTISPELSDYYNILGYIYLMQEEFGKAQFVLEYAEKNWNRHSLDNLFGLKMLSRVYEHKKDGDKQLSVMKKIRYLESGVFQRHFQDQTIHNGTPLVRLFDIQKANPN